MDEFTIGLIIGYITGGIASLIIHCCCILAKDKDRD